MVLIKKKLLVLSLYYHPDIGPGPTRVKSIIETLNKNKFSEINLITSYPFRYPDYKLPFDNFKILNKLTSKNYDLYKFGHSLINELTKYTAYIEMDQNKIEIYLDKSEQIREETIEKISKTSTNKNYYILASIISQIFSLLFLLILFRYLIKY